MTPLARGLLLLALYLAFVLFVAAAASWVKPRIPRLPLCVLALLPFLFVGGGVFRDRTLLPVDHAQLMPPWNTHPEVRRHNPYLNDVATQFLPWAKAMRSAWEEGSAPWRDRWNGCGTPLAANGQSAAFSPLTLLALPLPLPSAFLLTAAFKLFLALSGMWLWLRALQVSSAAALFGSVSFAFSFTMIPWLFAPQSGAVCLWPWLLFAVERQRDRDAGRRAFWLLAAVLALLPLSGHVESAAAGALFVVLWMTARWISRDLPEMKRVAGRVSLAALAALGLTAFSLVPQVLAILSSNRVVVAARPFWWQPFWWHPHGPVWVGGIFTTFLPRALGDSIAAPLVAGSTASFIEMAMGYVGIVGWACVAFLLRPGSKRRKITWSLLVPAIVGFGAATAIWPFAEILGHLPVLRYLFPIRLLAWVALSGSALAALELDRLSADLRAGGKAGGNAVWMIALLAIWVAMVSEHVRPLHAPGARVSQREALLVAEAALGASVLVVLAATRGRKRPGPALPCALAAVCAAELWMQGARLYRYGKSGDLFPSTPLVEFLRGQAGPFRVVAEDGVLFPNTNVFAGVEDVRTHDPVERRDYLEFLNATCGFPPSEYFKFLGDLNAPALDFLNVRYLISISGRESPGPKWRGVYDGPDGTVFENRELQPRVFAPDAVTFLSAAETGGWTRNAFEDIRVPASAFKDKRDWRQNAFLAGLRAKRITNGRADVEDYRESTNGASFRARVRGDEAFLVTSLVQDGGWTASDENGRPVSLTRANGPFLALRLSGGDHRISLTYRPPGFSAGLWISVASLAAALLSARVGFPRGREAAA
jgi:hypothetical protein